MAADRFRIMVSTLKSAIARSAHAFVRICVELTNPQGKRTLTLHHLFAGRERKHRS